jgi:hypothetical protein
MPIQFMTKRTLIALALLLAVAGGAMALVHDRSDSSPLAAKEFLLPALEADPLLSRVNDLPLEWKAPSLVALIGLGIDPATSLFDRRGARWGTLLTAIPLIPGDGVGNRLSWDGIGSAVPADNDALGAAALERLREYLVWNADSLRVDPAELDHRLGVHDDGNLIQVTAGRVFDNLPVRGAHFTAVIVHGNLILIGAERWGDIDVSLAPSIAAEDALARVARFTAPVDLGPLREEPTLAILPTGRQGRFEIGDGYEHRLVWVVRPDVPGDFGQWEALVDAHNGEILALRDLNHYGLARAARGAGTDRVVIGGVYPVSSDGIAPDGNLVSGYPMPYADLDVGGFTDSGGNFTAAGPVTTTLAGQFVLINDGCGAISETSTGDIDLEGSDGDTDCDVPPGHSPGDTAGARTTFYELNRIRELASGQLPGNSWLAAQLRANTNINNTCGAFWDGTSVNFFRNSNSPCENVAQLAGAIDHEWGHGMDDNDVSGSIPSSAQGGGEGMADIYAALRLNASCIGRGFFVDGTLCGGYGDPCTPASGCTGVRDIDWANRTSGLPHDLTWVQANCGTTSQCLGAAYSETVWDIIKRDLPALYGMDSNTALEVGTRLTFIGGGNLTGWFTRTGAVDAAGCLATQGYLNYLAADDDDGNVANGTPHMTAIAAAFDRHEIGCTPPNGGPTVTDSGCAGTPKTAPVVTATAANMGADLSWGAVADAASYKVYRTDGEHQCDFGKTLAGTTTGTTFTDSGLKNGRAYYYVVIPFGPGGDSCFGPASSCASVVASILFADGFESGDTAAWSSTVP